MSYEIIRLSDATFDKFHKLYTEVFRKDISYDILYQKYDSSYLGDKFRYWGYLALNTNQEAIGYCGCIPFMFNIDQKTLIGAHSCDHMTREDARGRGVFVKLNEAADQICQDLGADFVFGFPNQNNEPILIKYANWKIIDTIQAFSIPVFTIPLKRISQNIPHVRKMSIQLENTILNRYIRDDQTINRLQWNGIIRNKEYYEYKRYDNSLTLELNHGKAWIKMKQVMYIGDIELNQDSDFKHLIQELKTICRLAGIHKMVFLGSSKLETTQLFKQFYHAKDGNVFGIKQLNPDKKINFDRLRFTYGDYDSF